MEHNMSFDDICRTSWIQDGVDNKRDGIKYHRQKFLAKNHLDLHPTIWMEQYPCLVLDPTDYHHEDLVVFFTLNDSTPSMTLDIYTECEPSKDIPMGYEYYEERDTVTHYKEHILVVIHQESVLKVQKDGKSVLMSMIDCLKDQKFLHSTTGFTSNANDFIQSMPERNIS